MGDRTSARHGSGRRRLRSRRRRAEVAALVLGVPLVFLLLLLSVELIEYRPESTRISERPVPGLAAERTIPRGQAAARFDVGVPVPYLAGAE